jgi:hypothetical protein
LQKKPCKTNCELTRNIDYGDCWEKEWVTKKNRASRKACRKTLNFKKLTTESVLKKNLTRAITKREWASKRKKWTIKKNNIKKACKRKKMRTSTNYWKRMCDWFYSCKLIRLPKWYCEQLGEISWMIKKKSTPMIVEMKLWVTKKISWVTT